MPVEIGQARRLRYIERTCEACNRTHLRFVERADIKPFADLVIEAQCTPDRMESANSNSVYCFGSNTFGQLGIGSFSAAGSFHRPQFVAELLHKGSVVGLSAGSILEDESGTQTTYTWGENFYGQLGNGLSGDYEVAQKVVGLPTQ